MKKRLIILGTCLLMLSQICFAQTAQLEPKPIFVPNPKRAVLLGAILPGAGQIYNRKYWKVPFVYAGFGALVYAISWNGGYYTKYKKAYLSMDDSNPNTNDYLNYIPAGQDASSVDVLWLKEVLNQKQLSYRNNRDLAVLSIIGFYGLTLIDAFVDAQLYDFDISPNLNMQVEPVINNSVANFGPSFGLRCQLTF